MPRKSVIRVGSLDVGRLFHSRPARSVEFLLDPRWDVILVQNTYRDLVENKAFRGEWPVRHWGPMTNHFKRGNVREQVGIAICSRLPIMSLSAHAFVRHLMPVGDLDGVKLDAYGCADTDDLQLVRQTESRLVLFAEVIKDDAIIKVATVHGSWRPGGKVDDSLRADVVRMIDIVNKQGDLVVAGNFSAARGYEVYDTFLRSGWHDCLPVVYDNTLDYEGRGKAGPPLAVDGIYTTGGSLKVTGVELHWGVSDHCGITFEVNKE